MSISKIELKIENISKEETFKYQEILSALITSGALNLKNGKAILHFDGQGMFMGVQLDYWAFKRKKEDRFDPI
jgi:hypothetical protein